MRGKGRTEVIETKIGLLPLYLELYEEIKPGGHEEYRSFVGDISDLLSSNGAQVVSAGTVFTRAQLEKAEELFVENDVHGIALLHLSYSPSLLVADFIERCKLPVLIIDSTPDYTLDPNADGILRRDQAIHGVMDLTSVLRSRDCGKVIVAGHRNEPGFRRRLCNAVKALEAAGAFLNQTVGITGRPFAGMGDFSVSFGELKHDFGIDVAEIPISAIAERSSSMETGSVKERIDTDRQMWNVEGISEAEHIQAVKDYLALKSIAEEKNISGYTMNFQHIGDSIPTPFYACSGLMSEGYGFGGEGDVLTASIGRPMNVLSDAAKFDEFFCPDWMNNRILMSHMGESDARFIKSGSTPALVTREGFLNPHRSVIYRFQAEPGPATFVNISPVRNGGYRLVVGLLDIVDTELMPAVPAPHYQIDPRIPLPEFLEQYADAGGGHHLYVAKGDILEGVRLFCRYVGIDPVIIGRE